MYRCPGATSSCSARSPSQIAISLVQFGLPALTLALRNDRGVTTVEFAFLFGATGVGPAVALIAAGRLCDRIGARPVLIGGSIIGATGLTVAGFAPTLPVMFAALLVSGMGAAAVPVAGMTAILTHFPPDRRGRILGLRQMAVPVGGFVAAGLLPVLYHLGGLELAFSVPAVLVLGFGFLFAYAAGPGERQTDLPPMRASFPLPLRWVMVTGALYVTTLGGVLDLHGQRRARRRAVGDGRRDRVRRAQPGRRRGARRVGLRRRPGRRDRAASRCCPRSACSVRRP